MLGMLYATLLIPSSFSSDLLNSVISNIQFVTVRATCFVMGIGMGQAIKEKKTINLMWILLLTVNGLLVVLLTRHLVYGYFFFTLPLLGLFCWLIEHGGDLLSKSVRFMGEISLESYLLNGFLPKMVIVLFTVLGLSIGNNVFPYLIACILGCALGFTFHIFSSKLLVLSINTRV